MELFCFSPSLVSHSLSRKDGELDCGSLRLCVQDVFGENEGLV